MPHRDRIWAYGATSDPDRAVEFWTLNPERCRANRGLSVTDSRTERHQKPYRCEATRNHRDNSNFRQLFFLSPLTKADISSISFGTTGNVGSE